MKTYPTIVVTEDVRGLFRHVEMTAQTLQERVKAFTEVFGPLIFQGRPLPSEAAEKLTGIGTLCRVLTEGLELFKEDFPPEDGPGSTEAHQV